MTPIAPEASLLPGFSLLRLQLLPEWLDSNMGHGIGIAARAGPAHPASA